MVALLNKERPHATLNVYLTLDDNIQLLVEGNGTVHATGYFEPEQEGGLDGLMEEGSEDSESNDDIDEVEEE